MQGEADCVVYTDCNGGRRCCFAPALSGDDIREYPAWRYRWRYAYIDCMDKQGKCWCRRWHHVDGERNFSGILGEYSAVYDCAWDGKHDSLVSDCNKAKGEELQIAVSAFFACGVSVFADMRKVRGSLTVEAAIVIPRLLFLVVMARDGGVEMYLECRNTVMALEAEEKIDAVRLFYFCEGVGDIIGEGDSLYKTINDKSDGN